MVKRYVGYYFDIGFDIDFNIDCILILILILILTLIDINIDCIGSGCRGRSYHCHNLVVEDGIIIIFGAVGS